MKKLDAWLVETFRHKKKADEKYDRDHFDRNEDSNDIFHTDLPIAEDADGLNGFLLIISST